MNSYTFQVAGTIVDVLNTRIYKGILTISNGKILRIEESLNVPDQYILPGLVDAHIHIESSMLIPSEFARLAVVHGTVATVSDPHEIGNVLGIEGVKFMIENGKKVPFKFNFGAPSCVPATPFETSGASIGVAELDELLQRNDVNYLSEMMNFPGVIFSDPSVMSKLALAVKYGKPVDGHAPGLSGEQAEKYVRAGISTDHECFTIEEACDKIRLGMKILIREGSAAKNFETLSPLIEEYPSMVMFCSDDKHPNDLVDGHIDQLVRRSLRKGYDLMKILQCCTVNPVKHYSLDAGLLQPGEDADFIMVDNLEDFTIQATYVKGNKVAEMGRSLIRSVPEEPLNKFNATKIHPNDIAVMHKGHDIRVIQALDGQLITPMRRAVPLVSGNTIISDTTNDILKIVVKDRYTDAPPAVGFVSGFGLKRGALASSVAHDSHNIIAVGAEDDSITEAINMVIDNTGGISVAGQGETRVLGLPVAGIMSDADGFLVAEMYNQLDRSAKDLGSSLNSPFMTLSFMALLVIPELKLSDKGLFDGNTFSFVDLFVTE